MKSNSILSFSGALGLLIWGWFHYNPPQSGVIAEAGDRVTGNPPGKQCTVSPGSVYDGDTARFLCDGAEIKVRFCGIDAPEAKQPGGIEARDYLRSLLPDNAPVTIVPVENDRYGRLVAEVWRDDIEGEQNINANMV